jgi:MoaA/NifB/PqqE/SkfB family radical SAM enzyme
MDDAKVNLLSFSLCLSSKCNRGCKHCSADATMEKGTFFKPKQALLLVRELRRIVHLFPKDNLQFYVEFTGNGENLLNPDLVLIFDILFGMLPQLQGTIITSGIDPKSLQEKTQVKTILHRPYSNRLHFSLSFNRFEKRFPARLLKTLDLLFAEGVSSASIKLCLPENGPLLTIYQLDMLLERYFSRRLPLKDRLDPSPVLYCTDFIKDTELIVRELLGKLPPQKLSWEELYPCIQTQLTGTLPIEPIFIGIMKMLSRSLYRQTFQLKTRYGIKQIRYIPHFLTKQGRALQLDDLGWPLNKHRRLCGYQLEEIQKISAIHISSNGYHYPSVECPEDQAICFGHISDDFRIMLSYSLHFRKILTPTVIADQRHYQNICQHCHRVATKLNIFPQKGIYRKRLKDALFEKEH